jgi:gamma-glutamyltranspeptidase
MVRVATGAGESEPFAIHLGVQIADNLHPVANPAVDAEGNMVALTQTLGDKFGSWVIAGDTGVLFGDEMRHLHLDPNDPSRLEPGKRSRSNESPIIVLKDGNPFMAIGTPGRNCPRFS